MRFYFSRQGIPQIDIARSTLSSLPSTDEFSGKTIPFSHIYFSSENFYSYLTDSIRPSEKDNLHLLTASYQKTIAEHIRCPQNIAALNIHSVSDWHTHFANKKNIHILLVGGFGNDKHSLENGLIYLKRLRRLLAPVSVHFHLMQSNDAELKQSIDSLAHVSIYPDCLSVSQFFKADFYLDLSHLEGHSLPTKNLPLYDALNETNSDINETKNKTKVAVVIPHFGSQKKLNLCLDSLIKVKKFDAQWLYIVDNNAENRYFTVGVNAGIEQALKDKCDYFWVLNNDTQADINYLSASLTRFALNPKAGIVGGKNLVTNRPDRIFWGGSYQAFPTGTHKAGYVSHGSLDKATQESWATFSSVIIRGDTLTTCGLLDSHMKMIFSDSDYCFQIGLQGWEIWYEPKAVILHDTGVSRSTPNEELKKIFRKDKITFYRKWAGITKCEDPEKLQAAIFDKINFPVEAN